MRDEVVGVGALEHNHPDGFVGLGALDSRNEVANQLGPQQVHGRSGDFRKQDAFVLPDGQRLETARIRLGRAHAAFPALIESSTAAAYSEGSSSQTKWPASMITTRLLGSRSSRNSAFASGTTRSWRPFMIVTGVAIWGSSSASTGSSSGYRRT